MQPMNKTLKVLTTSHLLQDLDDFVYTIDIKDYDLCFFQKLPYSVASKTFNVPMQYVTNYKPTDSSDWETIGLCFTTRQYPTIGSGCRCAVTEFKNYEESDSLTGRYMQSYHIGEICITNCYPFSNSNDIEKKYTQEILNTCNANTLFVGVINEEKIDRTFIYKGLVNHSKSVNKVITRKDSNITITDVDVQEKYTTFNMTFKVDYGKIKNDGY